MIISSTESKKWQQGKPVKSIGINLSLGEEKQSVRGFGTCFSELSKIAIDKLSPAEYKEACDELFTDDGCGFNYCRIPIGASDFAAEWYSLNDTDGDFEMKNFSLERDKKYLIPLIKEALNRRNDLQFYASPWCPPLWMKTYKAYSFGVFRHEEKYYKAYALYFKKFVEGYKKEGINITQVLPQNEPCSNQVFPSCVWTGEQMANFIGGYLGKEMEGLADIIFGTINGPETDNRFLTTRYSDYLGVAMQNPDARKYIKGVGYQWAGKYALQVTHDDYPDLEIIQTECECGDGENTWDYCMYLFELVRHYFRNGASSFVYWNFALEGDASSTWGWKQNSLYTVKDGKLIKNHEFYMMKHVAKYVKRGAKYVEVKGEFTSNTVCFKNPDGSLVALIGNPYKEDKTVTIFGESYVLPARSINTIVK